MSSNDHDTRKQKDAPAKESFTLSDIEEIRRKLLFEGAVEAVCDECGEIHLVEPDADRYACTACGAEGSVTSPFVRLGIM